MFSAQAVVITFVTMILGIMLTLIALNPAGLLLIAVAFGGMCATARYTSIR